MKDQLLAPSLAGFGSFNLAFAVCASIVSIAAAFVHGGPDAAVAAARNISHRPIDSAGLHAGGRARVQACQNEVMSELLAALPKLFTFKHRSDYAVLVRLASADALASRAVEKTAQQMARAIQITLAQEEDHSGSSKP